MASLRVLALFGAVLAVSVYLLLDWLQPSFKVHTHGAIVLTGASSGIGLHAAAYLASLGFHVFAGVRKQADADGLSGNCTAINPGKDIAATTCAKHLIPLILDLNSQDSIATAVQRVEKWSQETGEPIVGLINNAAIMKGGPVELCPMSTVREVFETNYFGAVALTQQLLPHLRASQGRILFVGTLPGLTMTGLSAYSGSKHATDALQDSLRRELTALGVAVVSVNPGAVKAKIYDSFGTDRSQWLTSTNPVAALYLWMYSPKARQILDDTAAQADDPILTSETIATAMQSAKPESRYLVGQVLGVPVSFLVRMFAALPTFVGDALMTSST
eukprot:m.445222 g.445222  ORF g.445222 m.445222 type:complete len:331 (-) comp56847_c0_seq12:453-1445(-)